MDIKDIEEAETAREETLRRIIGELTEGTISTDKAVSLLLYEMGRGGRTLVVDENVSDVERHLSSMHYSTRLVEPGLSDPDIMKRLRAKVLITRNGADFVKFIEQYRFGLVWVVSRATGRDLARKISRVLMKSRFEGNLEQAVKV